MEKITRTVQILIDCETGHVSVRKKTYLQEGEILTPMGESNDGYMPASHRKQALIDALADRPLEQAYFDALWTPEYMAQKEAELEQGA